MVKDVPRTGPGRPRKLRPPEEEEEDDEDEEEDDDDEEVVERTGISKVTTSPMLLALENEPDSTSAGLLEASRHTAVPQSRNRGRPPRKKRGPKRRLIEEPGDDLPSLPHTTRLSEPAPAFISESSEDDDEDDDDDEELRSRSPPVLTKPTLGLKCKV